MQKMKTTKIGKLRIYMTAGESIYSKSLLRKMFPKRKYIKIMQEAKSAGFLNAHAFHTHAAVQKGGGLEHHSVEGDTSGLTVCVELIDNREKLEEFFSTHKEMLEGNTVIYKEVEIWEYNL